MNSKEIIKNYEENLLEEAIQKAQSTEIDKKSAYSKMEKILLRFGHYNLFASAIILALTMSEQSLPLTFILCVFLATTNLSLFVAYHFSQMTYKNALVNHFKASALLSKALKRASESEK